MFLVLGEVDAAIEKGNSLGMVFLAIEAVGLVRAFVALFVECRLTHKAFLAHFPSVLVMDNHVIEHMGIERTVPKPRKSIFDILQLTDTGVLDGNAAVFFNSLFLDGLAVSFFENLLPAIVQPRNCDGRFFANPVELVVLSYQEVVVKPCGIDVFLNHSHLLEGRIRSQDEAVVKGRPF